MTSERGPLDEFSPTKLDSYDPLTTWGCPTRFWFKYVERRPEPKDASLEKGEQMHRRIEHYGKTGEDVLGFERSGKHIIDSHRPLILAYETPVPSFSLEGIPISGMSKIDARMKHGIIDWKSTSDIGKYAKSAAQLRRSNQVVTYLAAARANNWFDPALQIFEGSFVYFQTKGTKAEKAEAFLLPDHIEAGVEHARSLLRAMKDVVKEKDPKKLEPNLRACDIGRGCPHRSYCPHKGGKEDIMASLISKFKAASTETPAPPPPATQTVNSTASALPPDAPKSDPAKAAEPLPKADPPFEKVPAPLTQAAPVEAPAPEPEKKKPGPKPGSKRIVIKDDSTTPDAPKVPPPSSQPHPEVHVSTVTVRHGLTLNMGNYSSAKVEVEMSGTYANGTAEQAREMLGGRVYAAAMAEAAKYTAEKKP